MVVATTRERDLLKNIGIITYRVLKWTIILVISMEVLAFVGISVANLILYGHMRQGSAAVYDPYTLFLMASGLRETAYNAVSSDPERNRTIWMFGGSTMRAETSELDEISKFHTIPSLVAKRLNERSVGTRFTIVNYGVNSFNSLLETKYLQKELIENGEAPDVIVFYDGANDSIYFVEHRNPRAHHGFRQVQAVIESYHRSPIGLLKPLTAAIYSSFSREAGDRLRQMFSPPAVNSEMLAEFARSVEKRYDYVQMNAEGLGSKLLVVWQPMAWTERCASPPPADVQEREQTFFLDEDKYDTMRRSFTVPYERIRSSLSNKSYFLDYSNALCGRTVPAYRPDGVHLTNDGNEMIAERLAHDLAERFFHQESQNMHGHAGKYSVTRKEQREAADAD